jgi:hypothetical protein
MNSRSLLALIIVVAAAGCGQNASQSESAASAPAAPAATAAPAAPKPATTVALLEPLEGAMGGHIDTFRWAPVDGADGYVIKITAVTGDRVVWESPQIAATETKLPPTVALEPEVHTWTVSARKGGQVLVSSPVQRFTITP